MPFERLYRWFKSHKSQTYRRPKTFPTLQTLESRDVPAGYLAVGAGPGGLPAVAIRVDIQDQLGGSAPNPLGQPASPRSDGKTDLTSQVFLPFAAGFRGGVNVATGNFDGVYGTPDQLVTAAGSGGGPHVIVWNMTQLPDGRIVTNGIRDQFFAFDARFRGGVSVACGDLDGDGRAELICGAGPGGGPHVRIYKEINGRFTLVNEFFAFDPGFRGGVSLASGQGYNTTQQLRLVLNRQLGLEEPFVVTPYDDPSQIPGAIAGIPLVGLDYTVPAGFTEPWINPYGAKGTPIVAQNGIEGHFDDLNRPLTYFTVAAGRDQYLSGNLLNQLGNIMYRPNIQVTGDNPDMIGFYVTAKWSMDSKTLPASGLFKVDTEYGPFVRIGKTADDVDIITRLTLPPDAVTFKNQLVIGAGPGGGPHVKVYDFSGTAGGQLINNGVGKEFFAFDADFRGGVSVGIGNVLEHQDPTSRTPGRIDYTQDPPQFIIDTTGNSGTQVFTSVPFDTELYRRDQPEIICAMMTGGSRVVVYADVNPKVPDPTNPFSSPAPARRTSLQQLNLQQFGIDLEPIINPNNPLGGYTGFTTVTSFRRAIDANFTGGVNFTMGALNFLGSSDTRFYGQGTVGGGAPIAVNPALGQAIFGAGVTPPGQANRASRVRIFNQLSPRSPVQPNFTPPTEQYDAYDSFIAFPGDLNARGASVAFGFGVLPEPGLDVNYAPRDAGANGVVNGTGLILYDVQQVSDPILI
jgi:hypothetical protein